MPIKITGKTGPHAGQEFEFGDDTESILFGRSSDAQVKWEPDLDYLSARHFSLDFVLGHYRIRMQGNNPVWLDGEPVDDEVELSIGTHVIAVATKDGPSYEVTTIYADEDLPVTKPIYETRKTARQEARGKLFKLTAWLAGFSVVAFAGYAFLFDKGQTLEERLDQSRTEFLALVDEQEKQRELLDGSDFTNVLAPLKKSVYMVAMRQGDRLLGGGTAWVVGDGTLATNAHVVEGTRKKVDEEGWDLIVISNQEPFTQHVVTEKIVHPHYEAFSKHLYENRRFDDNVNYLNFQPGFDVALLKVDQADELAPPLELAENAKLLSLSSAQEVAFIGYPIELAAGGGTNFRMPTPTVQLGNITSVTDYFMVSVDPLRNYFVQHSLPAHGGASGSPIFNKQGEVVAILSGGNTAEIDGKRMDTGIGVNFGQRVDVLRELMNGDYQNVEAERFAYWETRSAEHKSLAESIFSAISSEMKTETGKTLNFVEKWDLVLANDSVTGRALYKVDLVIPDTDRYEVYVAASKEDQALAMYLVDENYRILRKKTDGGSHPYILVSDLKEASEKGLLNQASLLIIGGEPGIEFELVWGNTD